jgi:hypothetical protein
MAEISNTADGSSVILAAQERSYVYVLLSFCIIATKGCKMCLLASLYPSASSYNNLRTTEQIFIHFMLGSFTKFVDTLQLWLQPEDSNRQGRYNSKGNQVAAWGGVVSGVAHFAAVFAS